MPDVSYLLVHFIPLQSLLSSSPVKVFSSFPISVAGTICALLTVMGFSLALPSGRGDPTLRFYLRAFFLSPLLASSITSG